VRRFIGVMAGTSLDGVDLALCQLDASQWRVTNTAHVPYPKVLFTKLHQLARAADNHLESQAIADREWSEFVAHSVLEWARKQVIDLSQIEAIGSHGQTIRHSPQQWTVQIGDPNTLSARSGCRVVADFRRADIALGGQGAPLVPIVHDQLFVGNQWACLNLGGIANVSLRTADNTLIGFDTGPANTLSDQLMQALFNKEYDRDGMIARSGTVNERVLEKALSTEYFSMPAPKSTGPELFSMTWWQSLGADSLAPTDQVATAIELTARSIASALKSFTHLNTLWLCGGGTHNTYLIERISSLCSLSTRSTEDIGVSPDAMEAFAFAVLAQLKLDNLPANVPSVTGASRAVPLGGIYDAR